MAIRFNRKGQNTDINDHNELLNSGTRTHDEIDSYLAELDDVRGTHVNIDDRITSIEDKNSQQEVSISDHETRITDLENNDVLQDASINDHEIRITDLETAVQNIDISDLKIDSCTYDATNDRLVITIKGGRASVNGNIIDFSGTTYYINAPTINTSYYLFLEDTGSISHSTSNAETENNMVIGSVTTVDTVDTITVDDLRYFLTKGGGGSAETSQEVIDARTDKNGVVYNTLKDRLDVMQTDIENAGGGSSYAGVSFHIEFLPNVRTSPQRIFEIPKYVIGSDQLEVYVDGVRVSKETDYTEKDSTHIEFNYDIFPEAHVICRVDGGGINPGVFLEQLSFYNIIASDTLPYVYYLKIAETIDFKLPAVEVLKLVPDQNDSIKTISEFNAGDSNDFELNNFVEFDGTLHLKTLYSDNMVDEGTLGKGFLYSINIDVHSYKDISSLEVI